jgi:type IV pilus assembly protein PilQ
MSSVAANAAVQLTAISSRVHAGGVSLTIEATEPVAYVATRPDPLTVVLDFRDVEATAVANSVSTESDNPIARVIVESSVADVQITRVRVALTEPVSHRVRSQRSTIIVDFDKTSTQPVSAESVTVPMSVQASQALAALKSAADTTTRTATVDEKPLTALAQTAGAAQQLPTPQPDPAPPGRAGRTYTGHPVSLDFQGADLRAVLRTFAEISGLNIVIDPTVEGSVDVALRDVPWDQALDQILRANKLGYLVDGTIVRVAPLTVLAEEEGQRRNLAEAQALAGDLHVLTRTLSYAKAEDMVALLTKSALSQRGTVQVDVRTNTLIITDLQDRLVTAGNLIDVLDKPQPQVEIEARIVQTTKNYARALGIQWGFTGRVDPALGNTTNLAFPNQGVLSGQAGAPGSGTAVDLGVAEASSAVGLALGSINGAFDLDAALSALERTGDARVLSTPRVSTQNNVEAEIAQGFQVGYQTVSNNTVTVNFRDAALVLRVKPQITAAGTVIMTISVDNGSLEGTLNNVPLIGTQRANTTVLVNDGQTTVIGGIYASRESTTSDRTPGLSNVPILRWLFKRDSTTDESRELLIFITPRIIQGVTQG